MSKIRGQGCTEGVTLRKPSPVAASVLFDDGLNSCNLHLSGLVVQDPGTWLSEIRPSIASSYRRAIPMFSVHDSVCVLLYESEVSENALKSQDIITYKVVVHEPFAVNHID